MNITLTFMSSSSDEFTHLYENSKKDISAGFPRTYRVILRGTQTWRLRPYEALYIWVKLDIFPNISHLKYRTGLILDEAFRVFIFSHFPGSGLSVLNGLLFTFESATVKTENTTSVNYLPSRFDNVKFSVLFNLSLTTTRSMKGKSLKRRIKKKCNFLSFSFIIRKRNLALMSL